MWHWHKWEWMYLRRARIYGYPVTFVRRVCRRCGKVKVSELDGHVYWSDIL